LVYAAGIPVTMFGVDNLDGEHQALIDKGITFHTEPNLYLLLNDLNQITTCIIKNSIPYAFNFFWFSVKCRIPVTMFGVDNLDGEHQALIDKGITFHTEPKEVEGIRYAIFDDTCGNLMLDVHHPSYPRRTL
jgi:hypothetical protein